MVKRNKNELSSENNYGLMDLICNMSSVGIPIKTMFIAIVIFLHRPEIHAKGLQRLSKLADTSIKALKGNHLPALEDAGFVVIVDEHFEIVSKKLNSESSTFKPKLTIQDVIDEFKDRWTKRYKTRCFVTRKERKNAEELVAEFGVKEVIKRVQRFIQDKDKWLVDRGHPFAIFASRINQYREQHEKESEIIQHGSDFEKEVERFEAGEK